jgi:LemA protein
MGNAHLMWILIAVVAVLVLWLVGAFNGLVSARNRVKEAWSDIDVQLKRRYDLIPNLIETVKGYASHEKEALEKVIQARAQAMGAHTVGEHGKAENMLSGALKNLFALSEAYPDLKASTNFVELQKELTDTEDKIQAARRFYNSTVLEMNNRVEQFPTNVIAGIFNFGKEEFFELGNIVEREPVKVSF